MREVCGTCDFNKFRQDDYGNDEFYCGNPDSELYGIPTEYSDRCDEWEEKD